MASDKQKPEAVKKVPAPGKKKVEAEKKKAGAVEKKTEVAKRKPAVKKKVAEVGKKKAARTPDSVTGKELPAQEKVSKEVPAKSPASKEPRLKAVEPVHVSVPTVESAVTYAEPVEPVQPVSSVADTSDSLETNFEGKRTRHVASPGRRRLKTSTADEQRQAPGSVSDRLKALSGRSYDVFRDRFLAKLRQSIRAVLVRHKRKTLFFFASVPQEIEDLVYRFFEEHYDDPFMDWSVSEACRVLEEKGWPLANIDEILEDCYRRL